MTFTTIKTAACVLATAIAVPLVALASDTSIDPKFEAQIRETLTAQGFEVRKIEIEDELFEAYALKDGQKYEVYMNADLEIMKIEED